MFCRNCGKQIPDDSSFCQFCGTATISSSVVDTKTEEITYTLTLDRQSQIFLLNPPIKVLIDDTIHLSVDNGKSEDVRLSPGEHRVELQSAGKTAVITLDLQRNTVIELGWNRLTGKLIGKVK